MLFQKTLRIWKSGIFKQNNSQTYRKAEWKMKSNLLLMIPWFLWNIWMNTSIRKLQIAVFIQRMAMKSLFIVKWCIKPSGWFTLILKINISVLYLAFSMLTFLLGMEWMHNYKVHTFWEIFILLLTGTTYRVSQSKV